MTNNRGGCSQVPLERRKGLAWSRPISDGFSLRGGEVFAGLFPPLGPSPASSSLSSLCRIPLQLSAWTPPLREPFLPSPWHLRLTLISVFPEAAVLSLLLCRPLATSMDWNHYSSAKAVLSKCWLNKGMSLNERGSSVSCPGIQ